MDLIQINHKCYYFQGPVNVGYINQGDFGVLIDTGIDKQVMKHIIRKLDEKSLPLTHLFITHAHADHYGGAKFLQTQKTILTYAPQIEEAILRNPVFEPMYLLQGNRPLDEMRNKFLEAPPIEIDHIVSEGLLLFGSIKVELVALPGHSINQLGVKVGNILYAADGYFGSEQLTKHKIPFIIDADATLATIEKLLSMSGVGMVPGHGTYEENPAKTLIENYDHHVSIVTTMYETLHQFKDGCNFETFMKEMCRNWEVTLPSLSVWSLYRTALYAYLIKGIEDKRISYIIKDYSPCFILND
ncbi:MBL fold metallo-hydrolase [Alkalihalobacillus sp. TS-13]|uniref:MBL fold metallo-hydrolase n=1 Tax=Alkalihalobacillus sp. TS-13 TaxID=2842455 RepID=UPI001C87EF63|nr:MBL fold metallo-hydrolase [Alkalihalobacillus sp. TS-13]